MQKHFTILNKVLFAFIWVISTAVVFPIDTLSVSGTESNTKFPAEFFVSRDGITSSIAKVLAVDKGTSGIKFTDPYNPTKIFNAWAGTFKGEINSQTENFYCIDIAHTLAFYTTSQPHLYIDSGATPSQITYILMNYYPYKTYPYTGAMSTVQKEAAAIQLAIWHFADGVNPNTIQTADIKARTIEIINDANANSNGFVPVKTLIILPSANQYFTGTDAQFRIKVFDELARPVANRQVTLSVSAGSLSQTVVTTDATGTTPSVTLNPGSAKNVTLTATAVITIPQGTRYIHQVQPNSFQKIVLATPATAQKNTTINLEWTERVDISLTKTVSNANPVNGENVTFTVSVANAGPSPASGVVAKDFLPGGLSYISSSASQGSFNSVNGEWTIGNLSNGANASLTITVKVDVAANYLFSLGAAEGYNVFTLQDMNQPTADVEGKVAVGRDGFFSNFSAGDLLPASGGTVDVLVVGRHLTFASGNVTGGNVVYGTSGTVSQQVGIVDGTLRQGNPVDFNAAGAYLTALSTQLAGYTTNGSTTMSGVTLTLNGADPFLNTFSVTAAQMTQTQEVYVNVPNGSVALINVAGDSIDWGGNLVVSGTPITNCMFNFHDAKKITIQSIDVTGSVLAPLADVNFISGVQHGQMICKSLSGGAQYNLANFIGNIPLDTTITNIAEIISCDQLDVDSNPGSGGANEDDYSAASIHVRGTHTGGGGSINTGNWQYVGSVSQDYFIWTFMRAQDGSMIAGTWGGKILRSTDQGLTFSVINNGMNVAYIWSLIQTPAGDFYAATERGVFRSSDNGVNWNSTSLPQYDVRSLLYHGNSLYAGLWGQGVYKSTDNGASWADASSGMIIKSVQALTKDNSGNIYAGTFGGGVYKSVDGGVNWNSTAMNYPHVWSLGTTSTGIIVAGTYGNGLYLSADGGNSWQPQTSGITATHIYSVSVDNGDNVFVSSWNNGVYFAHITSTDAPASAWNYIGLKGVKVSAISFDQSNGRLFAATSDGGILRNDSPTSVKEIETASSPAGFSLSDNYPNPFNPETVIEFSVPLKENVDLSVYNVLGELVSTLATGELEAGRYSVKFDAQQLPSGIYIYRLSSGTNVISKKMILMK
ncbi:MAG: choice-of-anchor A family protein [Bacteroidetes bacterium]|nr:choice-of-anchor A family protein [Bacteroidota bacterium]